MTPGYHSHIRQLPAPGTQIRRVYDVLHARKGRPVYVKGMMTGQAFGNCVIRLREEFGCDIIRTRSSTYTLLGEWIGPDYLDYQHKGE